ncbi:MAG: hypothetical protein ACRD2J_16880 [Thermoanaerobaculia bacterium]
MAKESKERDEPQSYGSGGDWVTGKTGQTVEGTLDESRPDEAFYDSSLDAASRSEAPASPGTPPSGGTLRERGEGAPESGRKIAESNETRQSFFRERDYD